MGIAVDQGNLKERLDSVAWGLLAVLVGTLAIPAGTPGRLLAIATGAGLLVVNAVRWNHGLEVQWLSTVLGIVVLVGGLAALGGAELNLFAAFCITLGCVAIGLALLDRRPTAEA